MKLTWKDCIYFIVGGGLYALSVNIFTVPANIAPGGATGIATLLHYLFSAPIGTTVLLLNIPLFLVAIRAMGWRFLPKTLIATVCSSLLIDLLGLWLPTYSGNRLLAALYGGVLSGIGLSLIFLQGATTGGSDLTARLLEPKLPYFSFGQILLGIDGLVILASAFVFRDVDSALYACIVIFASTTVIDRLLYNAGMGKVVYIISNSPLHLANHIMTRMERGVTLLSGQGGFSKQQKQIILCVVRRGEVYRLKQLVKQCDPAAFMIVSDAGQVMGEGFTHME